MLWLNLTSLNFHQSIVDGFEVEAQEGEVRWPRGHLDLYLVSSSDYRCDLCLRILGFEVLL